MKILNLIRQFLFLGVIVGPLPYTISNGQTIDAVPVMADFNWLLTQINANGAASGDSWTKVQLASSAGSSYSGFIGAGIGPVARSVQAKDRDIVSLTDFNVVGDGTTDDTAAIQAAAANIDASGKALYVPAQKYRITGKISFAQPPTLWGESYSPPVGPFAQTASPFTVTYATKGPIILSEVAADYAIEVNNTANYIPGLSIQFLHVMAQAGGSTGSGVNLKNCGWGGFVKGMVVEGFAGTGVQLSQVQDTIFDRLEVLNCGTQNGAAALHITASSNQLLFNQIRLEQNANTLLIDDTGGVCSFIDFVVPHIEQGPIHAPESDPYVSAYSSIVLTNVNFVNFIGGSVTGPGIISTIAAHGTLTPATCPWLISATGCLGLRFANVTLGSGSSADPAKSMNLSADASITDCWFINLTCEDYPIKMVGNSTFLNTNVSYSDVYTGGTAFWGIYGEGLLVRDNFWTCANGAALAKVSGSIFGSSLSNPMKYGQQHLVTIIKSFQFHDGNISIYGYQPDGDQSVDLTANAGVIDARLHDPHDIFVPTQVGNFTKFTNPAVNQVFTIWTLGAFTLTVASAAPNVLKGGVDAAVAQSYMLVLRYDGNTGSFIETSRNF